MLITRRKIVTAIGACALGASPAGLAQVTAPPMRRVGILTPVDQATYPAFVEALQQLGHEDGKNVQLLLRSAKSDYARLPALARELIDAKVEVIVAINTPGAQAAINATKTIPIIMTLVGDPIGSGFVTNMAKPGGNVTGLSNMAAELSGKRISILRELVPGAKRIAVMYNPVDPITELQIRNIREAAPKLGVEVRFYPVKAPADLPETFNTLLAWRAQAAVWLYGQPAIYQPGTIALAAQHKLPVMVTGLIEVDAGGLIAYVADPLAIFKRTATYVDKILKGARAGELPVEQPTRFELAINLKTAQALGLKVPQAILLQATKVIE